MAQSASSYSAYYASLTNDDLVRLTTDIASLVPEARETLKFELERRALPVTGIDWAVQPPHTEPEKSSGTLRRFFRNFGIFFACDVVCLVIAMMLIPGRGVDVAELTASLLQGFTYLSILLAFLTAKIFVPKQLKTLWFIGVAAPLGVLFFMVLFH